MAKFNPKTIQNLDNPPTAVSQINYNFETLQLLIDTLLSRDGATPNTMQSDLDMNNNRILNLPVPVSPTEPARHGDIQQYVDLAQGWAEYAEDQADRAEVEADDAEESAEEAQASLEEFQSEYLGAFSEDPVVDKNGNAIKDGAFYYNSTDGTIRVHSIRRVLVNLDTVVAGPDDVYVNLWVVLPVVDFADMADVDSSSFINGAWLTWDGAFVKGVAPEASYVQQDNAIYNGTSVQDALDDLMTRTSLGVYDIYVFAQGFPGNNEELFRLFATREFTIPVNATGSIARLRVAPSGSDAVFTAYKNGSQIGTITFADGSTTGVCSFAAEQTFVSGDLLSLQAPSSVNIAVRDLSITLACRR